MNMVRRGPTNRDRARPPRCRFMPPVREPPSSPPTMTAVPWRGEGATEAGQRGVPRDVDDDVVAGVAVGGVLAGVVDDLVGTEDRTNSALPGLHAPVTWAPAALGELHGQAADAARGHP